MLQPVKQNKQNVVKAIAQVPCESSAVLLQSTLWARAWPGQGKVLRDVVYGVILVAGGGWTR